mmetsp:Transcript_24296/g.81970  ORF Transcript_24296/g.81970 Transcript_24296/m.81970 type:complete len:201 (-) Transcript_24296:293-895(-)
MRGGDVRLARRLLWRNHRAAATALAARGRRSLHTGRGGCLTQGHIAPSIARALGRTVNDGHAATRGDTRMRAAILSHHPEAGTLSSPLRPSEVGRLARWHAPSPTLCLRPRRCDAGLLLRCAPGMWPAAARHAGRPRMLLRRRPSPWRRPRLHSWLGRARDGAGHVCGQVAARRRARRPRQPDRLAARGARGRGQAAGRG